ncbi:Hypothetical protein AA314_01090 [Archangium gephyra]|uniref:Uncharacterized protein n=1 Tax=Archangium gephyra TaxID=48 RepID=A0AAC8Q1Z7_9BACT|nr:Hypothetical protein AA314_01090 [Archangium gephyra]
MDSAIQQCSMGFKERFRALDSVSGKPVSDLPYRIELQDGRVLFGRTDEEGKTEQVVTTSPQGVKVFWEVELPEKASDTEFAEGC